jgi:hypothetical protein
MNEERKPTIDERIRALTESGQLVFEIQKDTLAAIDRLTEQVGQLTEQVRQADQRERKGRQAILTGVAAYLRALENGEDGKKD